MAVLKNTPRYLNYDADSRVVDPNQMLDALNIRVTSDDDGNSGVLKNMEGNTELTPNVSLPSGNNTVVGVFEHRASDRVFVIMHNSNNNHRIWKIDNNSSTLDVVLTSSNLPIDATSYLHISSITWNDDVYLYCTDGVNEPWKVNVDEGGSFYPLAEELSVAKIVADAPSMVFGTDGSRSTNDIYGKSFQFALKYIWRDGEESAIGHYSENICAPNTLNQVVDQQAYKLASNKITVTHTLPSITNISSAIVGVKLYFRDTNDNTLYYVDEYTPAEISAGVDFYNDKSYAVVSDAEYNKLQDSVPRTAQAQTISNNRLFYGNIVEGFDKQTVTATLTPNYGSLPVNEDVVVSAPSAGSPNADLDISTNAASLADGTNDIKTIVDFNFGDFVYTDDNTRLISLTINGSFVGTDFAATVAFDVPETNFYRELTSVAPANATDYRNDIISQLDGQTIDVPIYSPSTTATVTISSSVYNLYLSGLATFTINATANGGDVRLEFELTRYDLDGYKVDGAVSSTDVAGSTVPTTVPISGTVTLWDIASHDSYAQVLLVGRTFKSGESHSIGVVFEDDKGRTSGVYELGSVDIDRWDARANKGVAHIDATLSVSNSNPLFTKFFYVYNGGNTIGDYVQYSVAEVFEGSGDLAEGNNLYLSLRTLQGKGQSYVDGDGADIGYTYAEGDRLRVLSYDDSGRLYPTGIEYDVVGLLQNATASDLSGVAGDFYKTGDFVVVRDENYAGFTSTLSTTNFMKDCVVEIYSPKTTANVQVYRALSEKYDIADIGSTQSLTEGNAWFKQRKIKFASVNDVSTEVLNESVLYVESREYDDTNGNSDGALGGKPYAVIENERQYNRLTTITYSEPLFQDSAYNTLSSFNNSLANFYDYEMNYGGIYGLVDKSTNIIILQSDKVSSVPIGRNILTAGDSSFLTQSTDVLGLQQTFDGDFGINQDRDAFALLDGELYLLDVVNARLIQIRSNGIKDLTDLQVSSYFETRCKELLDATNGYRVAIGLDKMNNEVIISTNELNGSGGITSYDNALIYSRSLDKFTTFATYSASHYVNSGNRLISTRGEEAWEHDTNPIMGSFYGLQYDCYFKVAFNQSPSTTKSFHAMSIEGDSAASLSIDTKTQTATLAESAFVSKEDEWFAALPRVGGQSNYVVLGKVSAENDPNITFFNKVNRIPFRLGGLAYLYSGGSYTPLAGTTVDGIVDARTLTFTNAGSIAANDIIAIRAEDGVDGDTLRGTYAEVTFTFDDATPIEVFAVNASIAQSNLHNESNSQQ
jgi:hypothetical protein